MAKSWKTCHQEEEAMAEEIRGRRRAFWILVLVPQLIAMYATERPTHHPRKYCLHFGGSSSNTATPSITAVGGLTTR